MNARLESISVEEFLRHRSLLFGMAYRMLGRVSEAEDVVQETWLRWQEADQAAVRSPRAWLASVVTRLGIDRLRAASRQREQYYGVWLPEPLLEDTAPSAASAAEKSDALGMAFLMMVQALTPEQRAVFLLREVFDFDYAEIAPILGKSEASCRQLLSRARLQLNPDLAAPSVPSEEQQAVSERFVRAVKEGDVKEMLALLADDAVLYSDGGGNVRAAGRPIVSSDRIARFFAGVRRHRSASATFRLVRINGQPGVITSDGGSVDYVMILDVTANSIRSVYMIRNPEKLRHVRGPVTT